MIQAVAAAALNGAGDEILARFVLLKSPGNAVNGIHAAVLDNGFAQTIVTGFTQPDIPRPIILTPSGTVGNVTVVSCTVKGTDLNDAPLTEVAPPFTLHSLAPVTTVHLFKTITEVDQPTIGMGVSVSYGSASVAYFKSCERGAIFKITNVAPLPSQLPALRAWYGPSEYNMGANDFIVAGEVGGQSGIHKILELDTYHYSFDKDKNGDPLDLQSKLQDLEWAMVDWLNDADGVVNQFIHSTGIYKWWFTRGQRVRTSMNSVMKKFGSQTALPPGWFTLSVSVEIEVFPYA